MSEEDEKYTVVTSVGKFNVEKSKTHLKVGGTRFCVEIKFNESSNPELQWLITKYGGCELNGQFIKGEKTVHLLHLSFTLLKKYTNKNIIELLDNSKFDCEFSDGSKTQIHINMYNYLFHGGTWYENNSNAIPISEKLRQIYFETKPFYNKPSIKKNFNFNNPLLEEELRPIYEKANTWKEFAMALYEKYDKSDLCRKIAPWYVSAIRIITDYNMLPDYWQINISKIADIPYTRLNSTGGGKTRKRNYMVPNQQYYMMSPSELYDKVI